MDIIRIELTPEQLKAVGDTIDADEGDDMSQEGGEREMLLGQAYEVLENAWDEYSNA